MTEPIDELSLLLRKVTASENLVRRAEAYFYHHSKDWSPGVCAYFEDLLERKRDMIAYEWDRVGRMGDAIASGRDPRRMDI